MLENDKIFESSEDLNTIYKNNNNTKESFFHKSDISTPAYVYDQEKILEVLDILAGLKERTGCFLLYSIKSANSVELLKLIKPYVDGFSCSSLFEEQLAKEILDQEQSIHITTPGYKEEEMRSVIELSNFITLNSLTQLDRFAKAIIGNSSFGIRINPEMSFVKDERYDPCRPDSKLGITFEQLAEAKVNWDQIEGIHIHNNCESTDFNELKDSIEYVISELSAYKHKLKWINLGGGYLLNAEMDLAPLEEAIKKLQDELDVTVYIEPGKAVTGRAGYLIAKVIDLFTSRNRTIAVLDTSINHLPEVFEYQYKPAVMGACNKSDYEYRLVGCSCLSGDLFGDYYFNETLELGSRIVFENIGAYMQVKANMFNGINLPVTYLLDNAEKLNLIKQHDYKSFRSRV